jgi:hypothetical protein
MALVIDRAWPKFAQFHLHQKLEENEKKFPGDPAERNIDCSHQGKGDLRIPLDH